MTDEQPASPGSQTPDQAPKKKSPAAFWKELAILVTVAIVVSIVVRTFLIQTFYIPSGSMEHTLDVNDRVLVNKIVYDFRDPRRGEIVVFEAPQPWREFSPEKDYIKRVIGTPGDRLVCCDSAGRITVNGDALDEPYLFRDGAGNADVPSRDQFAITVPEGRLWVLGDHRSASADSRQHYIRTGDVQVATVPVDAVVGRAFVLFWPLSRFTWLTVPETFDGVPAPGD